jgi:hypothetical protein
MCGPAPFRRTIEAPNGSDDLYAADGSLREGPSLPVFTPP